ncbi:MAG: hypothetical protein CMC19_07145 [Flavobacteriaceae bacterium]|nr:hypothetical protein [Flavobacteriaceae bacterium]
MKLLEAQVATYELEYGLVKVSAKTMHVFFNADAIMDLETVYQLIGISEVHFRDQTFGVLLDYQNQFTIDPHALNFLAQVEHFKGLALLTHQQKAILNFGIVKLFFEKPIEVFYSLENAELWLSNKIAA